MIGEDYNYCYCSSFKVGNLLNSTWILRRGFRRAKTDKEELILFLPSMSIEYDYYWLLLDFIKLLLLFY